MPVDRGEIDAQLREIGEGERWWEQREFRELPYILFPGERIRGLTLGRLRGRRRPRLLSTRWLFVATDQRLLCLKHGRLARQQVDVSRGQIVRIQQRSGMRGHQITLVTADRKYRLLIPKEEAIRFARALEPLIPAPAAQRLDPALEALSWIPGMTTVAALPGVSGIMSRMAMLSPPDPTPPADFERLEAAVDRLQNDVERLQQQVAFLENLLQERAGNAAALPHSHSHADS
jgi:hypothetical protein